MAFASPHSGRGQQKHALFRHRGVTLVEVIVVIVIIAMAFLFLLMMVPRGREQAQRWRRAPNNLGQIGMALAIYDQLHQQLPAIAALAGDRWARWSEVTRPASNASGNLATPRPDRTERPPVAPTTTARPGAGREAPSLVSSVPVIPTQRPVGSRPRSVTARPPAPRRQVMMVPLRSAACSGPGMSRPATA